MAQADPTLVGRVFAVCEFGRVLAPCPHALAKGIHSGLSIGKARARLADLHVITRDKSIESLAWQELQQVLYGLTPKIEAITPGLLFCDVNRESLAYLMNSWDQGQFGVTAGCAADRATAHIAALLSKSGTINNIRPGSDWDFAPRVSLSSLSGDVSRETIDTLHFYGWKTLSSIRPLSRRQLEEQFDRKGACDDGAKLFRFAQGAKCKDNLRPIATWNPPSDVSARIGFEFPASEPAEWNQGLIDTLLKACEQLETRSAQSIEITAQTPLLSVASRRLLREPSSDPKTLILPLRQALEEALHSLKGLPVLIQGFEIRLGHLTVSQGQIELWEDPRSTRAQKLRVALERLDDRLPGKVRNLILVEAESPFEEERYDWASALERLEAGRHAQSK